jgi:uncharacterized protein YdeI (YjbR/CyaY-like superfamily)
VEAIDGVPVMAFRDAAAWEAWLAANHEAQTGVWVTVAKKGSGVPSVTEDELVDVGLCWGWISGQRRSLDTRWYLQRYVPRRPRSMWSKVNVDKVQMLLDAGRMREPGLAEVWAAQSDGRWDEAYASQRNATVPPDLAAALDENEPARVTFEALDRSSRYRLYLPVLQARSPSARARSIAAVLAALEDGAL